MMTEAIRRNRQKIIATINQDQLKPHVPHADIKIELESKTDFLMKKAVDPRENPIHADPEMKRYYDDRFSKVHDIDEKKIRKNGQ